MQSELPEFQGAAAFASGADWSAAVNASNAWSASHGLAGAADPSAAAAAVAAASMLSAAGGSQLLLAGLPPGTLPDVGSLVGAAGAMHNLVGAAGNMHHLVGGGPGSAGSVNNLAALALPTGGAAGVAGGAAAAPSAGAAGHGPLTAEEKRELIRQCVADLMRWPQFSPGRRKSAAELAAIRAAGGPTEAPDFKKVRAYLRSDDFKVYNQNLVEFLDDILAGEQQAQREPEEA